MSPRVTLFRLLHAVLASAQAAEHGGVGAVFQGVVQGGEGGGREGAAAAQGQGQEVVGQPGVLGQQRPVQVGAVEIVDHGALGAVLVVVAAASEHAPQRRPAVQIGAPAV